MDTRSLAFLASKSAIAIESNLNGKRLAIFEGAVIPLAEEMKRLSKEKYSIKTGMLMDFVFPDEGWRGKSIDEVYSETEHFADDLSKFKTLPETAQRKLMRRCIDLSRSARNYDFGYLEGFVA